MKLILPKTFIENSDIDYPLFYLAGPVLGGGNWQERCCMEIAKRTPKFSAVVPCQWQLGNSFFDYCAKGSQNKFCRQLTWEHHYLELTAELSRDHKGCIIFWLPVESKEHPRDDGQPYARDTYGELGRWGRSAAIEEIHIVIGAETGFPGLGVIRGNLELDFGLEFPIYTTLEETVAHALRWASQAIQWVTV